MLGCLLHCINGFLGNRSCGNLLDSSLLGHPNTLMKVSGRCQTKWRTKKGALKSPLKRSDELLLKREVRMWPFQRDACNFYHDFHNSIPYNYAFQSHLKVPIKTDWLLYLYTLLWDIIIQCCQSQFHASPWSKIRIRTRKCSFLYNDHLNPHEPTEAERPQSSRYQWGLLMENHRTSKQAPRDFLENIYKFQHPVSKVLKIFTRNTAWNLPREGD